MKRVRRLLGRLMGGIMSEGAGGVTSALVPAGAAAVLCVISPPQLGFRPQPLVGLALIVPAAVAALVPGRRPWAWALRLFGLTALWGILAWCLLSQPAPFTTSLPATWSGRMVSLVLVAALWLWLRTPRGWQQRGVVALTLPTLAGLGLILTQIPSQARNFRPYYLAVDSRGVLYAAEIESSVVRVFGPDGALRAKLRVGVASVQGPPGPGFSPPGPLDDPLGIGGPRCGGAPGVPLGGASQSACQRRTNEREQGDNGGEFNFCGLATDDRDRLYVADTLRRWLLQFAPNGTLEAQWPLPQDYRASRNCVAVAGATAYVSDASGLVYGYTVSDVAPGPAVSCDIPDEMPGGISISPDGSTLYALATTSQTVYACNLRTGDIVSRTLPAPSGPLGVPYQALLALDNGHLLVTNLGAHRLDVYCAGVVSCGRIGEAGDLPGQFGQVGGLARDDVGNVYVADFDNRVVQRFAPSGHVDEVFWSPEDDEIE